MRFAGKLHTWNEDRGFGFIRSSDGGQDIFVHVSALPTPRPQPDEVLTFEVGLNREGKKKATNVKRQQVEAAALVADGDRAKLSQPHTGRDHASRVGGKGAGNFASSLIFLAIFCTLGWYGYRQYQRAAAPVRSPAPVVRPATSPAALFKCDGRTMCSQMRSCEEATFFLRNCPGTKMDGNGDGVPCEKQWC